MNSEDFIMYIFPIIIILCFFISICGIIKFNSFLSIKKNSENKNEKNNLLKESNLTKGLLV